MLLDLEPPGWLLRHSVAVAEIAACLAAGASANGQVLDESLVAIAALLHDIDKALPSEHPCRRLEHGRAGAAWLTEAGHHELAPAVADHPVTRLADDDHWERWSAEATLEVRLVAYADKRATQDLVPMAERFAEWRRRYPQQGATTDKAEARALELEAQVCRAAGMRPEQVSRLAWVQLVLDQASAAGR